MTIEIAPVTANSLFNTQVIQTNPIICSFHHKCNNTRLYLLLVLLGYGDSALNNVSGLLGRM